MSFEAFNALSPSTLRALANSLCDGALSKGLSSQPIQQIAGARAANVSLTLENLQRQGMTPRQIGILVSAISETRESIPDPSLVLELVLSGPSVVGIPTRQTAAVVRTLFAEAKQDVLVAGYAIRHGEEFFGPLHERMLAVPDLAVRVCFDIRWKNGASHQEIVRAFANNFFNDHWPWPEQPNLFFYPRSLKDSPSERGSLHAKCVIVDRRMALITSANFTEAAQNRNIEAGVLIEYKPMVERLWRYFDSLVETRYLRIASHRPNTP